MKRFVRLAVALVGVVAAYQAVGWANGSSVPAAPSAPSGGGVARPVTPEEMAIESYNSGISRRDRAVKAENQALKDKKDSDRAKNEKKAREEYSKALKDFEKAATLNPYAAPAATDDRPLMYDAAEPRVEANLAGRGARLLAQILDRKMCRTDGR